MAIEGLKVLKHFRYVSTGGKAQEGSHGDRRLEGAETTIRVHNGNVAAVAMAIEGLKVLKPQLSQSLTESLNRSHGDRRLEGAETSP